MWAGVGNSRDSAIHRAQLLPSKRQLPVNPQGVGWGGGRKYPSFTLLFLSHLPPKLTTVLSHLETGGAGSLLMEFRLVHRLGHSGWGRVARGKREMHVHSCPFQGEKTCLVAIRRGAQASPIHWQEGKSPFGRMVAGCESAGISVRLLPLPFGPKKVKEVCTRGPLLSSSSACAPRGNGPRTVPETHRQTQSVLLLHQSETRGRELGRVK